MCNVLVEVEEELDRAAPQLLGFPSGHWRYCIKNPVWPKKDFFSPQRLTLEKRHLQTLLTPP